MKYSKIRKFSKGLCAGGYRDRAEKGETGKQDAEERMPLTSGR